MSGGCPMQACNILRQHDPLCRYIYSTNPYPNLSVQGIYPAAAGWWGGNELGIVNRCVMFTPHYCDKPIVVDVRMYTYIPHTRTHIQTHKTHKRTHTNTHSDSSACILFIFLYPLGMCVYFTAKRVYYASMIAMAARSRGHQYRSVPSMSTAFSRYRHTHAQLSNNMQSSKQLHMQAICTNMKSTQPTRLGWSLLTHQLFRCSQHAIIVTDMCL